jgi:hypothetical protein
LASFRHPRQVLRNPTLLTQFQDLPLPGFPPRCVISRYQNRCKIPQAPKNPT